MNPVEALWNRHHPPTGYPTGVVKIQEPIPGRAFFPGGYGLWGAEAGRPLPIFPDGGVMVLGHDFHSEDGYMKSLSLGAEPRTLPTWRNLVAVLDEAGVPLDLCFFTNLYVGLRAGDKTTGEFPGARDAVFVAHCHSFVIEQLRVQRPALILTLGIHVPRALGNLSPQLEDWSAAKDFRDLDELGPVRVGVEFGAGKHETVVVALTHPSFRHVNVSHRRYSDAVGAAAESTMLRKGVGVSRVLSEGVALKV